MVASAVAGLDIINKCFFALNYSRWRNIRHLLELVTELHSFERSSNATPLALLPMTQLLLGS
jgi:hypothetical protein